MVEGVPQEQPFPLEWQANTLRLTAFPTELPSAVNKSWWTDLVGEDPEVRTSLPKTMQSQEAGTYQSQRLIVGTNPGSIDWRLTPADAEEPNPDGFPVIGQFANSLEIFVQLMLRWLDEQCPPLKRLAFGAALVLPVENRVAGYRQLAPFIRVEVDPEGSSDLLYRINRPRASRSGIEGLRINRLSTWSVSKLALGVQADRQSFELPGLEYYACLLELDINTVPDFAGTLEGDQLSTVFEEQVALGQEIAVHGDIP